MKKDVALIKVWCYSINYPLRRGQLLNRKRLWPCNRFQASEKKFKKVVDKQSELRYTKRVAAESDNNKEP